MGEKKIPCSGFIILPTIEFVFLFALRMGWLISGLGIERSLDMHGTAMTTGLVQPVGPRLIQS